MEVERLRALLEEVRRGVVPVEDAMARLRDLPYEDLGFAKIDHHRALRNGFPEVIFCQGKQTEHILAIAEKLCERCHKALCTRATPEVAAAIQERIPGSVYHELARIVVAPGSATADKETGRQGDKETGGQFSSPNDPTTQRPNDRKTGAVLVVAAGTADLPVAEEAAITASEMGSPVERMYDVGVAGLHRLLDQRDRLFSAHVVIVVAGMEGALASVVGGLVSRPVVAVPTSIGYGASFGGLAPLLTMLNSCASGVAVMNIDNGFGAGYFAHLVNT